MPIRKKPTPPALKTTFLSFKKFTELHIWKENLDRMYPVTDKGIKALKKDQKANDLHIWTVVECENKYYIVSGVRYVNRIGFILTEHTIDEVYIEVKYPKYNPLNINFDHY